VAVDVANHIGEATTLHWHGMHLPAAMDGGPHQIIEDGAMWSPRFTIRQQAATLWFHPHLMGATREQVTRGLVGLFLLDDDNPAQSRLPHTYGVDDVPLVLQDEVFGANGQFVRGGRGQVTTLVNGTIAPTLKTAQRRLRFRLLNASSNRIYTLGLAGDQAFYQVASDGGLLPAPAAATRLQLGPAERVEIVVDMPDAQPVVLQSVRGGNGAAPAALLTIEPAADPAQLPALPPLPAALNAIERLQPETAAVTRDVVLGRDGRGFAINGRAMRTMADMHDMEHTLRVRRGDVEVWNVVNTTRNTHLFHVHDVQFQIVERSSGPITPGESGRKDTVMVRPGETVRIAMRFADYADPNTPYMFHCHILDHEDAGMMGQFVVVAG
jgi:FtsP/CotA-like multicopper oxidase with cupredoxin domain